MTKQERISNVIKTVSPSHAGNTGHRHIKNEPGPLSYTIHENKLKMDERSNNVRQEAIKILEEKAGKNLFDFGHSNFFFF